MLGIVAVLFLGLSLLAPAGWGIPSPAWAIAALVVTAPGLLVGWTIYRRQVHRGEVAPLGEGVGEDPGGTEVVAEPNAERAARQRASFRRAAGEEPS